MDKDTFLKLLVAQMKYQDPEKPTDSSAFITQTAAYSQVEALQNISDQNTSMLAMQRATSAGALVGKSVSYTATDGTTTTGTVSSVRIATASTEAQATVNGVAVPVGRLTTITA
ncbi:flagellar hook capping protein [Geodermatophilaceae bacterium NBWT11]|nr:flagellar hook capping protein [Geodermatophilaceae bacterium NBWT11]